MSTEKGLRVLHTVPGNLGTSTEEENGGTYTMF